MQTLRTKQSATHETTLPHRKFVKFSIHRPHKFAHMQEILSTCTVPDFLLTVRINLSTCTVPDFLLTVRIGELLARFYRLPCFHTLDKG
jgi:hypothetical protein